MLARQDADLAHQAFSKLFVQTEYLGNPGAILATRRRRSPTEPEIWAAHLAVVDGDVIGKPEIETDRARFLGRGHGISAPVAMIDGRAATLTWTQAQVQLRHLGITADEASLFQRLAGYVIYAAPTMRPPSEAIQQGAGAQSGLWAQGISGDLPIVLLRITESEDLDVARELLRAHEYWRMKQLAVDLVILNERQSSYT